jgi:hypothetical protein
MRKPLLRFQKGGIPIIIGIGFDVKALVNRFLRNRIRENEPTIFANHGLKI